MEHPKAMHRPRLPIKLSLEDRLSGLRRQKVEVEESSPRAMFTQCDGNEEERRENLDLLQEEREMANIREYAAKARTGNLVLRKILKAAAMNKLTHNWEGPFRVGASRWKMGTSHLKYNYFEEVV
ncbi:hypothetical protein CR513_13299, partial [Mucuna pruriens]